MKRINILLPVLYLTVLCFVACGKKLPAEDATGGQSLTSVKSLTAHPGYYRIGLSFVVDDEHIDYCEVKWGSPVQSRKIAASEAVDGTIRTIIEGLPEANYSFDVISYDANGRAASLSMRVQSRAYGDTYVSSLTNRTVKDLFFIDDRTPYIGWAATTGQELGVEVRYEMAAGGVGTVLSKREESVTTLPTYKPGTAIEYRSAYLPDQNCIDTFYAATATLEAPVYYSSVANKFIVEKSGLVASVLFQLSTTVHDDAEYSTLRFEKADGTPVSLFVVEADLSRGRLELGTLMPDNSTQFGLQTVQAMAGHRNPTGNGVLVAVNADFFDWTPVVGLPWGPVVVDGTVVKDFVKEGTGSTYIGTRKSGTLAIGHATNLTPTDYSDFQNLVGGGAHILYSNGGRQVYNDTDRHPRTMAGFTADRKVYLIVVDGRQPDYSVGMTIDELSLVIGSLGVSYALNLDGGGSSTMVLQQSGSFEVVNQYSDASPRAVANALAITVK